MIKRRGEKMAIFFSVIWLCREGANGNKETGMSDA